MKKFTIWFLTILVLAGIAFGLWVLYLKPAEKISFLTETVHRGNIEKTVSATGDVAPILLVDVGAQVTGQIKAFYVTLGQEVKKGDLIAEIDSATQLNDLNKAKAQLKSYQAQLESKKVTLSTADKNYRREKELWQKRATSQKDYEDAADTLASAKSSITELESSIDQAKIAVSTAETNLGYTKITAPVEGTIVSTAIEAGQTVNAVQSSPTIVQIADLSKLLIRMQVAEGDITKVQPGLKVNFTTLANPDDIRQTTISSIDPGLTTMSQSDYTITTDPTTDAIYYYARAIVDNSDHRLRIGMTTENTIVVDSAQNVLYVPTLTIKNGPKGKFVLVLKDEKPRPQPVTTGLSDNMNIEIRSGLQEGDKVISSQSDGTEVKKIQGPMGPPPT